MTTLDYAHIYETEIRPRRPTRRAAALALWALMLLVRPTLALQIWRERR